MKWTTRKSSQAFDSEYVLSKNEHFDHSFPLPEFEKVRELLPKYNIDPTKYSSGTLYQAVGLKMAGHIHNALHDVRSMAAAMHVLENTY